MRRGIVWASHDSYRIGIRANVTIDEICNAANEVLVTNDEQAATWFKLKWGQDD